MKKKILILAAIAVSGIAAVVASNFKNANACDCMLGTKEGIRNDPNRHICCVPEGTDNCPQVINGQGGWTWGKKEIHYNGD